MWSAGKGRWAGWRDAWLLTCGEKLAASQLVSFVILPTALSQIASLWELAKGSRICEGRNCWSALGADAR